MTGALVEQRDDLAVKLVDLCTMFLDAVLDESSPRVRIMIAKPRADSGNSEE